jgi:hypothetical protein
MIVRGEAARNERRKAIATTCNAMSVALVISIIIQPLNTGRVDLASTLAALSAFVVFQGLLHYLLGRVED